jgi:hypothetical protein
VCGEREREKERERERERERIKRACGLDLLLEALDICFKSAMIQKCENFPMEHSSCFSTMTNFFSRISPPLTHSRDKHT